MMSMERVYDMRRHVHVFVRDARVTQMDPRLRAAQLAIKRKQEEAAREKQVNILKKCSLFIYLLVNVLGKTFSKSALSL